MKNIKVEKSIPNLTIFRVLFCHDTRYKKLMMKSQSYLNKELDLQKFIYRQRVQTYALMGLLSGRQNVFVDKISNLVIRESSDMAETSSDAELSGEQNDE